MNVIYWDSNFISAFTDSPCAQTHKHLMLQLFLCLDSEVKVVINGKNVLSHCIILDSNTEHSFYIKGNTYYTMLIEPTDDIAFYMRERYIDKTKGYGIIDINGLTKTDFSGFITNVKINDYKKFILDLINKGIICRNYTLPIDKRVIDTIELLEQSDFLNLPIKELALKGYLSESRLTHLFKENTRISLKGYILMKKWKKAFEYSLEKGNITLAALEAGFCSSSHFASANKQLTGMTAISMLKNSRFLKVSEN